MFFAGNYFAHVATTRILHGESVVDIVLALLFALLLPGSGVARGLGAIFSRAKFAKTDLEMAARAGALCAVVKSNEHFIQSGNSRGIVLSGPRWTQEDVHEYISLPEGFRLVKLPTDAKFEGGKNSEVSLAYNYGGIKILLAIAQAIYAIMTLYETRGDQFERYGYAAFGFTVIQYAFMSLINLAGGLLCPEFPSLYIVDSARMDRARSAGPTFNCIGIVGRLDREYEQTSLSLEEDSFLPRPEPRIRLVAAIYGSLVPLAILGGLSHFHKGHSTLAQRAWTLSWVVCGVSGTYTEFLSSEPDEHLSKEGANIIEYQIAGTLLRVFLFSYAAPAIGGFIVVGKMLLEYGTCIRL